ncbi:hypothetical protein [Bacillus mycoides]|uniref:hypothetical protein n=1 Tax=Bacillus mycoides TaxID=1405 RepID=UPI0024AD849A|nr:hypothetical protein [Bacillus mycoides]MDI6535158.1 hypothetical protein [Bacillus mycoides]
MKSYNLKQAAAALTLAGFPVGSDAVRKLIARGKLTATKVPISPAAKTMRYSIEESELNTFIASRVAAAPLIDKEAEIKTLKAKLKALEGIDNG